MHVLSRERFKVNPNPFERRDWLCLSLVLLLATATRLIFSNDFFGSDDILYLSRAYEIARGIWTSADYNGALRYGFNIPAGFFIWIFGLSTFSAILWSLLCSIGEVALVYHFATRFIDRRVGLYAALLVATTPLHVAMGSRITADAALAFFLTMSFVLFFYAQNAKSRALFFFAGLSLGMTYWVKELSIVSFVAFLTYPLLSRRVETSWLWIVIGGAVMLLAHLILMQVIAGNPLHLFETVLGLVDHSFTDLGLGQDDVRYYFRYLLLDIKHTGLLGYISIAGLFLVFLSKRFSESNPGNLGKLESPTRYVAWWAISLLLVLSLLPVSLDPLRFVWKQPNYINFFIAPLAILAAICLCSIRSGAIRILLLMAVCAGGIALGALEQAAWRVFTSNSKAAMEFALEHPEDWVIGSVNNSNIVSIYSVLNADPELDERVLTLEKDIEKMSRENPGIESARFVYVLDDQETNAWGAIDLDFQSIPDCWERVKTLTPTGFGVSHDLISASLQMAKKVAPVGLYDKIYHAVSWLLSPAPSDVYKVEYSNFWCGENADTYFPDK